MRKVLPLLLILAVCLLVALGLTMLASTSYFVKECGGEQYSALQKQIISAVIGACACAFFALLNYHRLLRFRWWLLGLSCVPLVLVLVPGIGIEIKGAMRWLPLGPFNVQPSEFAKIALAIAVAGWFATNESGTTTMKRGFLIPGLIIALPVVLIGCEVDLGNALLAAMVGAGIMFVAGTRLVFLCTVLGGAAASLTAAVHFVPNRLERIAAVYHLEQYKDTWGLQQWISSLAFGCGGVDGRGLGASRMKLHYLPESHTDFIFPIVGEELGLYGTAGAVLMFVLIVLTGMCMAAYAPDRFGKLLGFALTLMLGLEALLNMGVTTALLPNKGLPLPFVSYGGSSIVAAMIAVGILINIHRQGVHLSRGDLPVIRKTRRWTPQL
ncbi:MAG: putative lipid II flippase FtsW [Verrucomicrobiaceae bacterium]|nr:putative lipid II flippase FtsW [Verrucomicrobiaceae bacterium]